MSKSLLTLEIDYDFTLLSMVSSYRGYRLCWHINKLLKFDLSKEKDIEIQDNRNKKVSYFDLYTYNDEINRTKYHVISNKSLGENLVPELKQVDFFLMMDGYDATYEKSTILRKLRSLTAIEAIFETAPNGLKSKQNLIFE